MATYHKHTFPSMSYPDVTEGQFYTSYPTFYVTVDSHPHDRVPPDILHGLLTPHTDRNRVPLAKQPKDEERHFWVAQLILYGLPHHAGIGREEAREIIRNALKVDKDGEMQLTVARNVKEVEGRLGKAVGRAWVGPVNWGVQSKASKGAENGKAETGGTGATGAVRGVPVTAKAAAKAVPVKPGKAATASARDKGKATDRELADRPTPAKKSKGERPPSPNAGPAPRKKQTARKNAMSNGPFREITGRWQVSAPYIEDNWRVNGQDGLRWSLGLDEHGYLVGDIDLGPFDAYLRSDGPADQVMKTGNPVSFHWRGHEVDTGQMVFGSGYHGQLSFDKDGFVGILWGGPIDGTQFESDSRSRVGIVGPRDVGLWMGQYNAINQANYDDAESDRWD